VRRPRAPENVPDWLQRCDLHFKRTGKLNLSGVPEPDLSLIRSRNSLKELNISRTKLTTIEGLAVQRNLQVFNADNSLLESFKNFKAIASASIYQLNNTPLSQDPNYLVAILLLTDSPRPIVDGKLIPASVRRRFDTYPRFAGDLLNSGWKLVYPCPEPDVMRDLCHQFNVTYIEDNERPAEEPAPDWTGVAGDLEQIDSLMGRHKEVIQGATRRFELLDESDARFQREVKAILVAKTGCVFAEEGDINEQIVAAVHSLFIHRQYGVV
jgi:hypothetical protein